MNKIDNYKYDNKDYLGKGSFGKVYKGMMIDKNKEVAIKSILILYYTSNEHGIILRQIYVNIFGNRNNCNEIILT